MSKRILIVDDNKPLARMMISALETLPYKVKVSSVPSGEEALLSVMLDLPDLMVVDLNLPGMNGLDLIQLLRNRYKDLKIVMATGEHDPDVFRRAEALGVEYRFPKPFETVAFLDAVNRILSGQGLDIAQLHLPAEPPERMEDSLPELSFSDAVVELQKRLNAASVVILGDSGRAIVQAGEELGKLLTDGWELPVMSALSAQENVQRHLPGEMKTHIQIYQTTEYNVVIMPVGRHGLVVVLPVSRANVLCRKEIEVVLEVQQRITTFTTPFEVAHDPTGSLTEDVKPVPEIEEEVEVKDIDIASLFSSSAKENDADSFWDTEEGEHEAAAAPRGTTGFLDFSQAEQLGLTPEDEG